MKYFSGNRVNQIENKCLNGYLSPLYNLFFFNGDSLYARLKRHYEHGVTWKRSKKKDYSIQEICLERAYC